MSYFKVKIGKNMLDVYQSFKDEESDTSYSDQSDQSEQSDESTQSDNDSSHSMSDEDQPADFETQTSSSSSSSSSESSDANDESVLDKFMFNLKVSKRSTITLYLYKYTDKPILLEQVQDNLFKLNEIINKLQDSNVGKQVFKFENTEHECRFAFCIILDKDNTVVLRKIIFTKED